jgi:hypothetical protein
LDGQPVRLWNSIPPTLRADTFPIHNFYLGGAKKTPASKLFLRKIQNLLKENLIKPKREL